MYICHCICFWYLSINKDYSCLKEYSLFKYSLKRIFPMVYIAKSNIQENTWVEAEVVASLI